MEWPPTGAVAAQRSGRVALADRDNVEALVVLQPIFVDTASPDHVRMLVMANGLLIAVLTTHAPPASR